MDDISESLIVEDKTPKKGQKNRQKSSQTSSAIEVVKKRKQKEEVKQ
jgi:hypothetical protein